jgi:hypothetical protein
VPFFSIVDDVNNQEDPVRSTISGTGPEDLILSFCLFRGSFALPVLPTR